MLSEQYTTIGWLIVKVLSIAGLLLYALYAGIMFRQEQLMSNVLKEPSETVLRVLTLAHLAAAACVIILALIIL